MRVGVIGTVGHLNYVLDGIPKLEGVSTWQQLPQARRVKTSNGSGHTTRSPTRPCSTTTGRRCWAKPTSTSSPSVAPTQ